MRSSRELVLAGGMDIARINCAHDDARHSIAIAERVRAAARGGTRRGVRVLMDLGGPKLRTGPIPDGPAVFEDQAPARCVRRAHGAGAHRSARAGGRLLRWPERSGIWRWTRPGLRN